MKKFLFLFFLLFASLPSLSAEWIEFAYNSYYDNNTWLKHGNYVVVWFKFLNPGDWKLKNNQKVWFEKDKVIANCSNYKVAYLSSTYYDFNGNVIETNNFDQYSVVEKFLNKTDKRNSIGHYLNTPSGQKLIGVALSLLSGGKLYSSPNDTYMTNTQSPSENELEDIQIYLSWFEIVPDTVGEDRYNLMCNL